MSERERSEHLVNLGRAIRAARGPLTQARLGSLLDVPQTSISRWEKGLVALDVIQVHEIELALGLDAGALLNAAGITPREQTVKDVAKAVITDPNIDALLRRDFITIYDNYVKLSKRPRH